MADTPLQPHQERVVEEKRALDDKLLKLSEFIIDSPRFRELPDEERLRMRRQADVMSEYSKILGDRIAAF